MNIQFAVPEELSASVSLYKETIDITKYIPEDNIAKIVETIDKYAKNNYGMDKGEYVISLRVISVRDKDKSRVFYSYLLGGEKIGEARTFSGPITEPQKQEPRLPYYIFDVQDLADFEQPMIGHGPRTFRLFIDKTSLTILDPQRLEEIQRQLKELYND